MTKEEELLESLAALEHDQWRQWSQQISTEERISDGRLARWKATWVPYSSLSEASKEQDRAWAREVLDLLSDFYAKRHKVRKGDLVEVVWYDAGYDDKIPTSMLVDLIDPMVHLSWGRILGWTERYLRILQTMSTDKSNGNAVLLIPWGVVDKVRMLRPEVDSQNGVECESDKHSPGDVSRGKGNAN